MTTSEFAFLALGLVLGLASGAAIVVVLGSRPPVREVKVTVRRDAVPRRSATLSSDAFTLPGEPARGGPADRRHVDRDSPTNDPPPPYSGGLPAPVGRPVIGTIAAVAATAAGPPPGPEIRTTVPSWPGAGRSATPVPAGPVGRPVMAAVSISPERDPSIDALRVQAVLAVERAEATGHQTATAILDARPASDASGEPAATARRPVLPALDPTPAIVRILRGDHRALLRTVEVLAGADDAMRRPWQAAVTALAEAIIYRAIDDGVLDFPVGNPFWDTFTTAQCRSIAEALSATGHRFDGIDGWADGRLPGYRELAAAVALAGIDPRRIRAWPTQAEIAALYAEVAVAADEYLTARAPDLDLPAARELGGTQRSDLELLWRRWDLARPVLAGPISAT